MNGAEESGEERDGGNEAGWRGACGHQRVFFVMRKT